MARQRWVGWFKFYNLIIPSVIAAISTVWFTIGGIVDLRRMFRRLAEKQDNDLDNGRVVGHVSTDDVALVEQVDHVVIEEAHVEETLLKQKRDKKQGNR